MAEINNMAKAAIIVSTLAIIVLMTLAVVQQFEVTLRTDTTDAVNGITVIVNNTATPFGGAYDYVSAVTGCINETDAAALDAAKYTVFSGGDSTTGGGFVLLDSGADFTGSVINCSAVTYLAESDASKAADKFKAGLAIFATFLGVLVLAIVGKLVIGLFKGSKY